MRSLTPAEARLLAEARAGVLATVDPAGRPRPVPVCFVVLTDRVAGASGAVLYTPLDDKPKRVADPHDLARVRDLIARPEVSLLVHRWDEDWRRLAWLRVAGRAGLLEPDDSAAAVERTAAIDALRTKYPQYVGHDLETGPLIRIELTDATSWGDV